MTEVLMPALSPTMEEGTLAKWHVKAGDKVASGDVIAEIETDKATMEVEAVDEGVVTAILVPEGTEGVKVNTPIATLKGEGEAEPAAPPPTQPKAAESKAPVQGASSDHPRAARDQGQEEARERQANPAAKSPPAEAQPAPSGPRPPADPPPSGSQPLSSSPPARFQPTASGGGERIFASPLARRMAEKAGADLSKIKGSGPHGRIIAADLGGVDAPQAVAQSASTTPQPSSNAESKLSQSPPKPAQAPSRPAVPPAPQDAVDYLHGMGILPETYTLQPLDGMRRTIAKRLTDSFRDVPHFPLTVDLEIDRLLDARHRLNAALEKSGTRVSVNDILIKASALALKVVPAANASFTPKGIALHHHADVAVAVAIEGGLITPIIREAESRSLADISKAMKDLAARARDRKLKPEEFQGGTFSLSNLGMFGIRTFSSILNQPQGMILSVGAGEKRPVARGDALAVATVMTVTLTCDHRVVDGSIGAAWLQAFRTYVEDPVTMLA